MDQSAIHIKVNVENSKLRKIFVYLGIDELSFAFEIDLDSKLNEVFNIFTDMHDFDPKELVFIYDGRKLSYNNICSSISCCRQYSNHY